MEERVANINTNKIAFLRGQRQHRSFAPGPIEQEAVDQILEVARWTGSANNRQSWRFLVVDDPELLSQLAETKSGLGWVKNAGLAILVLTEGATVTDWRFDAGRVAERLLLASNAVGLSAGIVSWSVDAGEPAVRSLLNIPDGLWIYAAVILGHPAATKSASGANAGRKSLDDLVIRNRFS
jgi:nitroreductase